MAGVPTLPDRARTCVRRSVAGELRPKAAEVLPYRPAIPTRARLTMRTVAGSESRVRRIQVRRILQPILGESPF
jgi:hypothetical protein